MASIKVNRTKYGKYIRAVVSGVNGTINLKTSCSKVALHRIAKVQKKENEYRRLGCIEEILNVQWEGDEGSKGRTTIKRLMLQDLIIKFLEYKKTNIRPSSVKRLYNSMNCLMNVLGKTCPVSSINNKSIEDFKKFYKGVHKNNGININLRGIRQLVIWAVQEGYIKQRPIIKMMPTTEKIKYIKDSDWDKILR